MYISAHAADTDKVLNISIQQGGAESTVFVFPLLLAPSLASRRGTLSSGAQNIHLCPRCSSPPAGRQPTETSESCGGRPQSEFSPGASRASINALNEGSTQIS